MKFSALIMVVQAGLFICVNVLIEDCRSGQCETRENRVVRETRRLGKKVEAGKCVSDSPVLAFSSEPSLIIKNDNGK